MPGANGRQCAKKMLDAPTAAGYFHPLKTRVSTARGLFGVAPLAAEKLVETWRVPSPAAVLALAAG